jgi:hypothetical protein
MVTNEWMIKDSRTPPNTGVIAVPKPKGTQEKKQKKKYIIITVQQHNIPLKGSLFQRCPTPSIQNPHDACRQKKKKKMKTTP